MSIQDQFFDNLKSYNGCNLQIWKIFISTVPNFAKTDIPAELKDTKEIPIRHLILSVYKFRKSGQPSVPRQIYPATTIPTLTILGVGIIAICYKFKKQSAKIYRLARNRGITMEIPSAMLCQSVLGTKMRSTWKKIIPHSIKKDSVFLKGVK